MRQSAEIYGSTIYFPEQPSEENIDGYNLPKHEQYWRRKELPEYFDEIEYDEDKNAILNDAQKEFASKEVEFCKKGYWFFNNGVPTYITGKNYFYLQWWKLEDDIYPDYRDADRRYFLFLDFWEKVLWCIGIFRGKKRREGASSQATSNLIYECIFYTSSNCGLVSKTNIDSRETFTDMVSFGYNQLPVFLKPRQLNRADSVTELVFAAKAEKGFQNKKGLRSKVNYRAPAENAYDRGRISRLLAEEGGKWQGDAKFSKFISKASKTMIKGAKRVGFCEAPSTVNELTASGGLEFKKVWDSANQFKSVNKKTPNRFITYFTPAYDNYEGFIDRYGMSVIDEPTSEQYDYLISKWVIKDPITKETVSEISKEDIKLGAKEYVQSRRKGLDGDLLEEEIRQNPCSIQEMFEAANIDCVFDSHNLHERKKELEENPPYRRCVLFYRDLHSQKSKWRDITKNEKSFHWQFTSVAELGLKDNNKFFQDGLLRRPSRANVGAISVDSYSNSQGGRKYGSKACALIGNRADALNPNNTGKAFGMLYGRPEDKNFLHEQVMLCAEFFGFPVWYEHTADDYDSYFRERGRRGYLGTYPLSMIDPVKRLSAEKHRGTPITPFSLTKQLDNAISYIKNNCNLIDFVEIIDNALLFDPTDRTKFDIMVSFLILISVLEERSLKQPPRKTALIQIYEQNQTAAAN
jgi:hypothetical protein